MAATIDIVTSRGALETSPTVGTLAVVVDPVERTAQLWVFTSGGWMRAAHGAQTNAGD